MKANFTKSVFTPALLEWYQQHHRSLPWRATRDPYRIWLSEIILQQTRVSQGLPYYIKFVERYPTVSQLAAAEESEVLRLWQGLGYYSRARHLHACARTVVDRYGGQFPDSYEALLKLPGVGDYTASAIASFSFKIPVPVVDGNVFRVLARLLGINLDIAQNSTRKVFKDASRSMMDEQQPDLFNQAIMEFGALHCTPQRPQCSTCPFMEFCHAFHHQQQQQLPVKGKKSLARQRYFYYFVAGHDGSLLMKERKERDIWRGLYDFFLVEHAEETDALQLLEKQFPEGSWLEQIGVKEPTMNYIHKLSHQQIHAQFVQLDLNSQKAMERWKKRFQLNQYNLPEIAALPKSILINNYLKAAIF